MQVTKMTLGNLALKQTKVSLQLQERNSQYQYFTIEHRLHMVLKGHKTQLSEQ